MEAKLEGRTMQDRLKSQRGGLSLAFGAAMLLAAFTPGGATAGDRAGVLQCRLSGNSITVLVENQELDCVFQDDDEGALPAHYIGKLTKVGANATINGPGEIAWGVVAATSHIGPGALAGLYAGPNTSVKVGVGGGGAFLIGGNDNTISLQPLQFEAGSGVGVTAGIENLALAYVPDRPVPHFKKRHLVTK
jgi:hypothetical protein